MAETRGATIAAATAIAMAGDSACGAKKDAPLLNSSRPFPASHGLFFCRHLLPVGSVEFASYGQFFEKHNLCETSRLRFLSRLWDQPSKNCPNLAPAANPANPTETNPTNPAVPTCICRFCRNQGRLPGIVGTPFTKGYNHGRLSTPAERLWVRAEPGCEAILSVAAGHLTYRGACSRIVCGRAG